MWPIFAFKGRVVRFGWNVLLPMKREKLRRDGVAVGLFRPALAACDRRFRAPEFDNVAGISGSPVFDQTANALLLHGEPKGGSSWSHSSTAIGHNNPRYW
jgi:hypothetical protein